MDKQRIIAHLEQPINVLLYDTLPSTNDAAKTLARQNATHGTAILSEEQTAGRGRYGKRFFSPSGGLYLSMILDCAGLQPGFLTTLAAVAALHAIRQACGLDVKIRWVNDLLYEGLKVGGILTEGILVSGRLSRAVIGIGLNTGRAELPADLAMIAGSLNRDGESVDRERLAALIINNMIKGLPKIPEHMEEYRMNCATLGRPVHFILNGEQHSGIASAIEEDGALLIRTEEGLYRLAAGEASVRVAEESVKMPMS